MDLAFCESVNLPAINLYSILPQLPVLFDNNHSPHRYCPAERIWSLIPLCKALTMRCRRRIPVGRI